MGGKALIKSLYQIFYLKNIAGYYFILETHLALFEILNYLFITTENTLHVNELQYNIQQRLTFLNKHRGNLQSTYCA